jgi:hypothetical protein
MATPAVAGNHELLMRPEYSSDSLVYSFTENIYSGNGLGVVGANVGQAVP